MSHWGYLWCWAGCTCFTEKFLEHKINIGVFNWSHSIYRLIEGGFPPQTVCSYWHTLAEYELAKKQMWLT